MNKISQISCMKIVVMYNNIMARAALHIWKHIEENILYVVNINKIWKITKEIEAIVSFLTSEMLNASLLGTDTEKHNKACKCHTYMY